MNVCSIWPFAQISVDFYYLNIWQCARFFVAALFKELPSEKCEVSSLGLGLELPGLGLNSSSLQSHHLIDARFPA